jgi:hypothetical protein
MVPGKGIFLKTVDRTRRVRDLGVMTVSSFAINPLVWSPSGDEIWCTSYGIGETNTILAFDLRGRRRVVARFPVNVALMDLSATRQALVATKSERVGIGYQSGDALRDLSWMHRPWLRYLAPDGSHIIFNEFGEGGTGAAVYIRQTDGSMPARLAGGMAMTVSRNGRWLSLHKDAEQSYLTPVGAGESVRYRVPRLESAFVTDWLANDRFVVFGKEVGRPTRHYIWDRPQATVHPLTPEGTESESSLLTADEHHLLARSSHSKWRLYPLTGGAPSDVRGIEDDELPIVWARDGRSVFVAPWRGQRLRVYLVETRTGARKFWREIGSTPGTTISMICMTPDGRSFAYQYSRESSDLYLVEGLQ